MCIRDSCQMADVVFLGLHGADGEGGKVQAAFDLLGIRYTGTDFVSGALAMDKCLAKELFMPVSYTHLSAQALLQRTSRTWIWYPVI